MMWSIESLSPDMNQNLAVPTLLKRCLKFRMPKYHFFFEKGLSVQGYRYGDFVPNLHYRLFFLISSISCHNFVTSALRSSLSSSLCSNFLTLSASSASHPMLSFIISYISF